MTSNVAPTPMYSHTIEVPAGHRLLVISGQLGIDEAGNIPDDAEAQARLCLAAIDRLLAKSGLNRENVLRLNAYVTDRAHMPGYATARNEWVADLQVLPCSTLLAVSGFVRPEFLVEVEALASSKA
ncbi:enamine deaminase RidA [Mesorhizobium sp. Root102]|uniref:RidA family protein n=1 Tax=Mesorhizobium sp. Root102 TaxID=1736422 RepID=UPI0006FF9A79|nr:RidA family protein [Mesorhizobium sp. Root102]KQU85849.1 enamine deaminase RidA [Mesorhizobium sp. Root102]